MEFKVIEGGLKDTAFTSSKNFRVAYITNTRLMGVVCVHAIWDLPENDIRKELHQFFYFDAEEFGFDTYESVMAYGPSDRRAYIEIEKIMNRMMGGLGADIRSINEKELRALVQHYAEFSRDRGDELPENYDEYKFLLYPRITLSPDEFTTFMNKACVDVKTPFEAINYFIMRCTGKDYVAAKHLTIPHVRTNLFEEHEPAALLRNVIHEAPLETGANTSFHKSSDDSASFKTRKAYTCESLIEYDERYFILRSEVELEGTIIVDYKRLGSFEVSAVEADMMTSREEHITLLNLKCDPEAFDNDATEFAKRAMMTEHDNGRVFMVFYPNNDHVRKQIFKLSDDVLGCYYISDAGQILIVAYENKTIKLMENDLLSSVFGKLVTPVAKYCFKDPVFYDFIESDFDDFQDFVEIISEPES